jgi:hypothetical protein
MNSMLRTAPGGKWGCDMRFREGKKIVDRKITINFFFCYLLKINREKKYFNFI